jgi:chemotaxis response regulator CheB
MEKDLLIIGEEHPDPQEALINHLIKLHSQYQEVFSRLANLTKYTRDTELAIIKKYKPDLVYVEENEGREDLLELAAEMNFVLENFNYKEEGFSHFSKPGRLTINISEYAMEIKTIPSKEPYKLVQKYEDDLIEDIKSAAKKYKRSVAIVGATHIKSLQKKLKEEFELNAISLSKGCSKKGGYVFHSPLPNLILPLHENKIILL